MMMMMYFYRWVLLPQEGCLECDSCTDALIFSVQDMGDLLSNETQEFKVSNNVGLTYRKK